MRTSPAPFAEGRLGKSLIRLVLPMFVGMVAIALVGVVDAFFIGMLGTQALAAFGLCFPAVMLMQGLMFGLANGITASVARARGRRAGEPLGGEERLRVRVAVAMAFTLAAGLGLLGVSLGGPAFRLSTSPEVAALAEAYYHPYLLSLLLLAGPMSLTACMRGFGETRSSATVMTLGSLLNAGLDPVFMFGWGPIPAYGMAGASISTVAAYCFSTSYAIWLMQRTLRGAARSAAGVSPRAVTREVSAIAGPAMLAHALGPVAHTTITAIATGFGATALAGLGIMQRMDLLVSIVPVATGAGLMPLVGQLAGKGERGMAAKALRLARRSMAVWGLGVGLCLNLLAAPLTGLFTQQPEVAAVVRLALLFAPLAYLGVGLNLTTMSCFNATGHPLLATKLSALFSVLLLPLGAYAGSRVWGLSGMFGGAAMASATAAWFGTRFMAHAGLALPLRLPQPTTTSS